jgi:hypothetical protein
MREKNMKKIFLRHLCKILNFIDGPREFFVLLQKLSLVTASHAVNDPEYTSSYISSQILNQRNNKPCMVIITYFCFISRIVICA